MRNSFVRNFVFSLLAFVLSLYFIAAQTDNCPEFVNDALLSLEDICSNLGRNEVCYGHELVESSFLNEVSEDFFSEPASIARIDHIETIRTAPMNIDTGVWGVAVMNIQANLPNTLPGQNVTFILLGDVELENAVAPEEAFVDGETLEVVINTPAGANVRSGPSTNYNVIGGIRDGEPVLADGLSVDSQWLRVAYRERAAWISRSTIVEDEAIDSLPILNDDLKTPMQSFYLRTGIGQASCEDSPDNVLLVQGPDDIVINITVNGVDIRLGSTGALRTVVIDDKPQLEVTVLEGTFEVENTEIHTAERSLVHTDANGNHEVSPPVPVEREEFGEEWCDAEKIPEGVLNYNIEVLCPGEVPTAIPTMPVEPTTASDTASESQVQGLSCDGFAILGPFDGVTTGNNNFAWTAVNAPNPSYELVFYNQGTQVNVFSTTSTSMQLNMGSQTSTGGSFQWEVRAFSDGQYLCVTNRTGEIARNPSTGNGRSSASNPIDSTTAPDLPVLTATTCSWYGGGTVQNFDISWADAVGTVTIEADIYTDSGLQHFTQTSGASTGTVTFTTTVPHTMQSSMVSTSSGQSVGPTNLGFC
jgi:hypothetical protein